MSSSATDRDRTQGTQGTPLPGQREAALEFDAVTVAYRSAQRGRGQQRDVLRGLSLRIAAGESYGLVGESGCGKSTAALAAVRYLPSNGQVRSGEIRIAGKAVGQLDARALRRLRANDVSMVYQDAGRALNPSLTIGRQLAEAYEVTGMPSAQAYEQAHALLSRVRIDSRDRVMRSYPHQLSGGMQQRVVIAMALAPQPSLLILDEPTTGLDATVEAEVLDLLRTIRDEQRIAMLFISHNLAVVEAMCDRVGVLYAGELVEEGAAHEVFTAPRHPYTVGLLRCLPSGRRKNDLPLSTIPGSLPEAGKADTDARGCIFADRCGLARPRCRDDAPPLYRVDNGDIDRIVGASPTVVPQHLSRCHYHEEASTLPLTDSVSNNDNDSDRDGGSGFDESSTRPSAPPGRPVLRVSGLSKTFGSAGNRFRAVDSLSFTLSAGETLGLVGESGSGKSTLAKLLLGLEKPDEGSEISIDGIALPSHVTQRSAQQIRALQVVFQNPDGALNRAWTVRRLIARSIRKLDTAGHRWWSRAGTSDESKLSALLASVKLPTRFLNARAAELSGGLKQRVAIARAFAGHPRIVVCDEPTSALDVSVQAAILNLLTDLQRRRDVSYLFISHDLDVVRYLSDRIAVLYRGRIVEIGPAHAVLGGPNHPYTAQLLAASAGLSRRGHASSAASAVAGQPAQPQPRADETRHGAAESSSGTFTGEGCPFHTRCPQKIGAICEQVSPASTAVGNGHQLACHLPPSELPNC
jgi:peptide/nickel transport system ATP-binding protein